MKTLEQMRKEKGLSQTELAQMAGISRGIYNRIENGAQKAGSKIIRKLSEFYGLERSTIVRAIAKTQKEANSNVTGDVA